jgi:hypothetical protein
MPKLSGDGSSVHIPKAKSWERQDDEPDGAWAAFKVFRDMDPEKRSVRAAYEVYSGRTLETEQQCPGSHYELSAKWKWKERVIAYEREYERRVMQRIARKRLKAMEEIADLGETLRKKAATAARMITAVAQSVGMHDGKEVLIMAVNLTPDQIVKFADAGTRIEQLALGMPTERIEGSEKPSDVTLDNARMQLKKRILEIRARREEAADDDE